MKDDTLTPKKPKGYPRVKASHGRLQLMWRYQGEAQYLSLGMDDNYANRVNADDICLAIWSDIKLNRYNSSNLEQYLPDSSKRNTSISVKPSYTYLWELWDKYVISQSDSLAITTVALKFPCITKFLSVNKDLKINDPESFVNRVNTGIKHETLVTKYGTVQACISWAVREKLISENSFKGYSLPKNKEYVENGGDPFESWEIVEILDRFRITKGDDWWNIVKFLLLTGARPSECFGLEFRDINFKTKKLTFQRRLQKVDGITHTVEGLKTQNKRVLPMSDDLTGLLLEIKVKRNPKYSDVVLTVRGKPCDTHALSDVWYGKKHKGRWQTKGVVSQLVEEGLIDHYRSAYSLRDTFITHALKAGTPIHTVAKWVGNSPAIIDRHYAGGLSEFIPPNLL